MMASRNRRTPSQSTVNEVSRLSRFSLHINIAARCWYSCVCLSVCPSVTRWYCDTRSSDGSGGPRDAQC